MKYYSLITTFYKDTSVLWIYLDRDQHSIYYNDYLESYDPDDPKFAPYADLLNKCFTEEELALLLSYLINDNDIGITTLKAVITSFENCDDNYLKYISNTYDYEKEFITFQLNINDEKKSSFFVKGFPEKTNTDEDFLDTI